MLKVDHVMHHKDPSLVSAPHHLSGISVARNQHRHLKLKAGLKVRLSTRGVGEPKGEVHREGFVGARLHLLHNRPKVFMRAPVERGDRA